MANEQTKNTNSVKATTLAAALVAAQGEFTAVAKDLHDCIFRWLQLPYEEGDNE